MNVFISSKLLNDNLFHFFFNDLLELLLRKWVKLKVFSIGFPPIPGQKAASPEQGLAAVLETANKLTSNEADDGEEDDEEEKVRSWIL